MQNRIFTAQTFITHDVDELIELVKPWNLELKKIDKNPLFFSRIEHIQAEDLIIFKTNFSSILEQKGAPPEGMRTFWIPVDDEQFFYLRNNVFNGNSFGLFPIGSELDATSKPGFKVYVISIPEWLLIEKSARLGFDWTVVNRSESEEHMHIETERLFPIRETIEKLYNLQENDIKSEIANLAFASLKNNLIELLILNMFQYPKKFKLDSSNKLRIYKKFREYVHEHQKDIIRNEDLCNYTCASERSLQYTVKSYLGVSPNHYVKAYKLHQIRTILKKGGGNDIKISDLASQFGFWHTSQFTADYKKQFGELPSDTLKKKRIFYPGMSFYN